MTIGQVVPEPTAVAMEWNLSELIYGIPAERVAEICQVALKTARRWKATRSIPASRRQCLLLALDGDLGAITGTWAGFKLLHGELVTPEGDTLTPGDVRAISYRRQQVRALKRALAEPCQWKLFK